MTHVVYSLSSFVAFASATVPKKTSTSDSWQATIPTDRLAHLRPPPGHALSSSFRRDPTRPRSRGFGVDRRTIQRRRVYAVRPLIESCCRLGGRNSPTRRLGSGSRPAGGGPRNNGAKIR